VGCHKVSKKKKTIEELLEEALVQEEKQPYEVPKNWKWVKMGSVITLISGRDLSTKLCNSEEKGIPYIMGASNIVDNQLDVERWIETPTVIGVRGDILVSVKGTVGKVIIQELDEVHLSRQIMALRSKDTVLNKFLYLYIQTYVEKLKEAAKGIIPGISRDDILNAPFPLLPLNEQKRIADKVERLLSKIDEAKQLIEEAKETFELRRAAILDKAFRGDLGTNVENEESITNLLSKDKVLISTKYELPNNWGCIKLGDVVKFQGGSQPPKSVFKEEQLDDYIRLIQIRDFKSDKYKTYIPKELAKRTFVENDVMIGRYGPPVFQILRGMSGAYNVALMKAIPVKELMDNDFLYYLLQAPFIQNPVIKESHRTAGQTGVRKELIEDLSIGLPPLNEQKRIAEKVENLLKKFEAEHELVGIVTDNLAIIKQSILSKAFRGELGTNDPSEESAIELLKEVLQEQVK